MKRVPHEVPRAVAGNASFRVPKGYRQTVHQAINITRRMRPPTLRNHFFTEGPQQADNCGAKLKESELAGIDQLLAGLESVAQ